MAVTFFDGFERGLVSDITTVQTRGGSGLIGLSAVNVRTGLQSLEVSPNGIGHVAVRMAGIVAASGGRLGGGFNGPTFITFFVYFTVFPAAKTYFAGLNSLAPEALETHLTVDNLGAMEVNGADAVPGALSLNTWHRIDIAGDSPIAVPGPLTWRVSIDGGAQSLTTFATAGGGNITGPWIGTANTVPGLAYTCFMDDYVVADTAFYHPADNDFEIQGSAGTIDLTSAGWAPNVGTRLTVCDNNPGSPIERCAEAGIINELLISGFTRADVLQPALTAIDGVRACMVFSASTATATRHLLITDVGATRFTSGAMIDAFGLNGSSIFFGALNPDTAAPWTSAEQAAIAVGDRLDVVFVGTGRVLSTSNMVLISTAGAGPGPGPGPGPAPAPGEACPVTKTAEEIVALDETAATGVTDVFVRDATATAIAALGCTAATISGLGVV